MNFKKKAASTAAILGIGALAIAGTSLAYFTDQESKTNAFTVGNVDIELLEDFDEEAAKSLKPAVGSAQDGSLKNGIKKEVSVKNTGSENAYVRVHIAIPTLLDNADASGNILHFNYGSDSVGEKKWDWSKTTSAPYEGDWNTYSATVDDVDYTVYVVTYEDVLKPEDKTVNAINQVYLDSRTTKEQVQDLQEKLGKEWKILVKAEGVQAEGFDDAYTALNTAFGAPAWETTVQE